MPRCRIEIVNFDHPFWQEPVVHAYGITIRPGRIKGWGMHKLQTDRYAIVNGSVRVVLFDGRSESPTQGLIEGPFAFERKGKYYLSYPHAVGTERLEYAMADSPRKATLALK